MVCANACLPRRRCARRASSHSIAPALEAALLSEEADDVSAPRNTRDGPWCWAAKSALKRIQDATGENEGANCRARSVYLALCEISSDKGCEEFNVNKALIAFRAGLSVRTVQRVLPDLERAGVVLIRRSANGLRTASTYILTGHNGRTYSHNDPTIGHGGGSELADRVKEPKELKEPIAPAGAIDGGEGRQFPKPRKTRERDPLLDSLAAVGGADPQQVTPKSWPGIAAALKDIRAVCPDVSAEEIKRRAANYRQHMPTMMLTAHALAKNWAICDRLPAFNGAKPTLPEASVRRI